MPHNPTIHKELKVTLVFSDGDGGEVFKATDVDGNHYVYPLDVERAIRLANQLTQAAQRLLKPMQVQGAAVKAYWKD
jgi:hypothetical protein